MMVSTTSEVLAYSHAERVDLRNRSLTSACHLNNVNAGNIQTCGSAPREVAQPENTSAHDPRDDQIVIGRIKNGDLSAFEEIVARYRRRIYSLVRPRVGNDHDAEELTQDTFVQALRGLVNYRGDAAFSTWLYQIAINLTRNHYWYWHRRKREQMVSLDSPVGDEGETTLGDIIPAEGESPYDVAATEDLNERIGIGMECLPNHHREILIMRNIEHVSYAGIATILNISVGTVKSRIARAREGLRSLSSVRSSSSARGS